MAALALLQHYFEYLRSPSVLLTIFAIVGPITLELFKNTRLAPQAGKARVKGCFKLGLSKRTNLQDQHEPEKPQDIAAARPRIKALFTYPVKSCRGIELAASEVGATGLKYDRLFTFAQMVSTPASLKSETIEEGAGVLSEEGKHEWRFITQREFPRLALLATELWAPDPRAKTNHKAQQKPTTEESKVAIQDSWAVNGGCLIIRFPFEPDYNLFGLRTETITIPIPLVPTRERAQTKSYTLEPLSIWKDKPQAMNVTSEIASDDLAKLKYFLGVSNPLGLFRVDQSNMRTISRSLPKDRPNQEYAVGFADAFPFHLLNLASVRAQDGELPEKNVLKGSLDARRFRANVYVSGAPAYDEDSWKRIAVGRCLKPNETAFANGAKSKTRTKTAPQIETDGEYHVACRTARCKLPNVDQSTGVKDTNEPLSTLSRTRKVDKGAYPHPCLGMQMIPLFQQGILKAGDEIVVLERGEHVYEKMFS